MCGARYFQLNPFPDPNSVQVIYYKKRYESSLKKDINHKISIPNLSIEKKTVF